MTGAGGFKESCIGYGVVSRCFVSSGPVLIMSIISTEQRACREKGAWEPTAQSGKRVVCCMAAFELPS